MTTSSKPRPSTRKPKPASAPKRDFDASIVGGPAGSSALAFVTRMTAEAQARMDALAAAGKPFVPVYRRLDDPAENLKRAMESAMASDWHEMTLDRFNGYTPALRESALRVANFLQSPRGILYITGGIGSGKTHLAAGAAIRLVERGYIVRVWRATDMAKRIRAAAKESNELEEVMRRFKNVRVLVVDDLGAEHMTDFLAAEWFDLFDYRYRQHAATIITSNVAPEHIGIPRLASRFQDSENAVVLTLTAKDYRALPQRPAMDVSAAEYAPAATVAPVCNVCGGNGIVKYDLPIHHSDFGRAFPCPRCRGAGPRLRNGGEK